MNPLFHAALFKTVRKDLSKNVFIKFPVILLLFYPFLVFAQPPEIKSGNIQLLFDEGFKIQWMNGANNESISFVPGEIIINGEVCSPFSIDMQVVQQQISHDDFGICHQAVITGYFRERGLDIRQTTKILIPAQFPNVAIFQTTYQNLSKERVLLDSIKSIQISATSRHFSNDNETYNLASFQGGINEWGRDYSLIWLTPGFEQDNFQGTHQTADPTRIDWIGGGMPFIDIWGKNMGVALAHLETEPQWLSLPVKVKQDSTVVASIAEVPDEAIGMDGWIEPDGTYQTVTSAVIFHQLDFHDGLRTYGELLRKRGIGILNTSPEQAYEPYWKSWGFELDFTLEEIYGILPELKSIGINVANLDDGWFDYYGDWKVNRSSGKFPNGEKDMSTFVDNLHQRGFKTNLWWYPLGVSPESELAIDHPDLLVMNKKGEYPKESRGLYQLCPAYQPAMDHVEDLVERFTKKWGYDGLYSDTRGLSAVPPCYNPNHNHQTPLESFQSTSRVFEVIDVTLRKYNKEALHEVCICAVPHSPYNMPYYQISSASDPINLLQTRRRIKVEKAIHGPTYAAGDCYQVPDDEWSGFSVPQSFESAVGTGGQVTTFYTDLDSTQYDIWKRWIDQYRELKLSSAVYTNLYDIAFDTPEVHVVRKGADLYYGIYAGLWSKADSIELRGLEKGVAYLVYDYANERDLGKVSMDDPYIRTGFRDFLLLRVTPE